MPIIYKRSESPEFDLSDPKYQSTAHSNPELGLDVDELDLLPPVAIVAAASNATTKHHQQQRASSSSSASRSTPVKRMASQAPPPKRLRAQEEHPPSDRASTSASASNRLINASEHPSSSDDTRPRPRPPPKTGTNSSKRPPPALFKRVRREDDLIGKQHGMPSRLQAGVPTPSTSAPPRAVVPQRRRWEPQNGRQQPLQRPSSSAENAPIVRDPSSPDNNLRPRRTIHPTDREMRLPSEQSPPTKPPSSSIPERQLTNFRQIRTEPLDTTDPLPTIAARSAGPPRSDESNPGHEPRRGRNFSPRASSDAEANATAVRPQRNERLMRPASVRWAEERRTNVVVGERPPAPPPPTRQVPRSIPQDEKVKKPYDFLRLTNPPPNRRRTLDTQPAPPPPHPLHPPRPPHSAPRAQPAQAQSEPQPIPLPKFQFPDVETFLANLPLPLTHLTPTVAAFGCSSQADLLALSARSQGGEKARRVMMDELERRGDLTPWQRIVVEAELEVLGERAAG
ncbi:BQ2448_404 [Microbotryum intermedium]|uniref:BQ2448_404 protein n=1 Tax=Microbotryum intermedium TaxID=269621 RepID=A0A238F8D3_9BASI|nr:BQ2448_404 [Microbotryum intermedium]